MKICGLEHDEIAYDVKDCPICELREELNDRIVELEEKLNVSKLMLKELEDQIKILLEREK